MQTDFLLKILLSLLLSHYKKSLLKDGPYLLSAGSQVYKLFIFDNVKGEKNQVLRVVNLSKNTFCHGDKTTINSPERNQRHIYK